MPPHWSQLYGMLNNTCQKPTGECEPQLQLVLAARHHYKPIGVLANFFLKTRLGTTSQKAHFRCDQTTYERGVEK
jgi:hypothetical protein